MANQGKRMVSEDQIKKLESLEPVDLSDYQKKLTAGENITISEDNVISAAGSGGDKYYAHNIILKDSVYNAITSLIIINESMTPFTITTFLAYLSTISKKPATGIRTLGTGIGLSIATYIFVDDIFVKGEGIKLDHTNSTSALATIYLYGDGNTHTFEDIIEPYSNNN